MMTLVGRQAVAMAMVTASLLMVSPHVHAAAVVVSGVVTDPGGAPVDDATVRVLRAGTAEVVTQTSSDPSGFYTLVVEQGHYDFVAAGPAGSGVSRSVRGLSVDGDLVLDLELAAFFVEVSGVVVSPWGVPVVDASVVASCPGSGSVFGTTDAAGGYVVSVVAGVGCSLRFSFTTTHQGTSYSMSLDYYGRDLLGDTVFDPPMSFPMTQLDVAVVNPDGSPADVGAIQTNSWFYQVEFGLPDGTSARVKDWSTTSENVSTVSVASLPVQGTEVHVHLANGASLANGADTRAPLNQLTLLLSSPVVWLGGLPGGSGDGDNVSDVVEALGPNGGDGNGDGVPDYEQANVTSLPSSSGNYVTIAAPTDSTLVNVRNVDPGSYTPPVGLVLPEGLTDFKLDDVVQGGDVTLSIYTASTEDVTGYAKLQDGVWVVLPDDRVQIFDDRVEITLTDGGVGDDDGIANGTVVDPGGLLIQTGPLDTVPPVVSGVVTPGPNAAGWNNSSVTVSWTAVDPEPSSGLASTPAAVVVAGEGAGQVVVSDPACDMAGNCATGSVTVSIDQTSPVLAVTMPATAVLGETVTATCAASDVLSGIGVGCVDRSIDTTVLGVGVHDLVFAATDQAGNTVVESRTLTVTAPANRVPVVGFDMGIAGLDMVGFRTSKVTVTGSFSDPDGNGPFAATIRWTPTSRPVRVTLTGTTYTATHSFSGKTARPVSVEICDAAGACGSDTLTVFPGLITKITPRAVCVTDHGLGVNPRYTTVWGYTNPAGYPIAIPVRAGVENTINPKPNVQGQPTIFQPGTNTNAFTTNTNKPPTWKLTGTTANTKTTPPC